MSLQKGADMYAQTHPQPAESDDSDEQPPGLSLGALMFAASRGDQAAATALKAQHHTVTEQRVDYDV